MSVSLTETQFRQSQKLIARLTGIQMSEAKRGLVERRLTQRIQAIGEPDIDRYLARIESGDEQEIEYFTNAVTTNLTSFFRENHHFEYLKKVLIPRYIAQGEKTLRIWSAACSTGEEAYSIAMVLAECVPDIRQWKITILATDIDTEVVATARRGVYAIDRVEGIEPQRLRRWFLRGKGARSGSVRVKSELLEMIDFQVMNLLSSWPDLGVFDVIFCRNVVIYFDKETQKALVHRFRDVMHPDGLLIMGHSESLNQMTTDFRLLGRTIYKRVA